MQNISHVLTFLNKKRIINCSDFKSFLRFSASFLIPANSSQSISAASVVLTTGTFLSGSLFMGQTTSPGGRIGDAPSSAGLSHTLRERLGLKVGRLRTGTPPRILKDSVDLSLAQLHPPDSHPTPFSFMNTQTRCKVSFLIACRAVRNTGTLN